MKKILFTLVLMLLAMAAVQAQSLIGKYWAADFSTAEMPNAIMVLSFDEMGRCTFAISTEESIDGEDDLKMIITFICPGVYLQEGNELTLLIDFEKADSDFSLESDKMTESTIKTYKALLKPSFEKEKPKLMKELIDELPTLSEFTIVKLTEDRLVLNDGESDLVFSAVNE